MLFRTVDSLKLCPVVTGKGVVAVLLQVEYFLFKDGGDTQICIHFSYLMDLAACLISSLLSFFSNDSFWVYKKKRGKHVIYKSKKTSRLQSVLAGGGLCCGVMISVFLIVYFVKSLFI